VIGKRPRTKLGRVPMSTASGKKKRAAGQVSTGEKKEVPERSRWGKP